jgi:hypothetical protein
MRWWVADACTALPACLPAAAVNSVRCTVLTGTCLPQHCGMHKPACLTLQRPPGTSHTRCHALPTPRVLSTPFSHTLPPTPFPVQARITRCGGQVVQHKGARVQGVLAMTRALGDHALRPYVVAEPEVTRVARSAGDQLLLLASDGLWDVMSCQVGRGRSQVSNVLVLLMLD